MQNRIIHLHDCPPQAWKNGMGRTCEIAVHPSTAGGDDFLWRVSIAEVDSAAPFSSFPGIDRSIVLLDGAGFTITLDGTRTHALTTPFAPFAFPGEAAVSVSLAGGPTRDFNLMLRRVQAGGEVMVWREVRAWAVDPSIALVYCARGRIDTIDGPLKEGDAWRPEPSLCLGTTLQLHPDSVALAVRVDVH